MLRILCLSECLPTLLPSGSTVQEKAFLVVSSKEPSIVPSIRLPFSGQEDHVIPLCSLPICLSSHPNAIPWESHVFSISPSHWHASMRLEGLYACWHHETLAADSLQGWEKEIGDG